MSPALKMEPSIERAAPLLSGRDLAYRYPGAPAPTFAHVDLDIAPGEFVALIGGSGVGKSTLLRALAGLVEPEVGTITGSAASDAPERAGARRRAVVFQDARLLPWFTLARNVGYGLEGLGLPRAERAARVAEVLELTGLADYADRYPHQLSGGQQQRGGIARALAVRPDVLLMDEPFSAVDAITRVGLQDELMHLHARTGGETGTAVLFVTHDIDEAVLLADRVLVMRGGVMQGGVVRGGMHAGGPARVVAERAIRAARPRVRGSAALAADAAALRDAL